MTERALDRAARRAGHAMLRRVTDGCLDVIEGGQTTTFGSPSSDVSRAGGDPRSKGLGDAHAGLERIRSGLHRPPLDDR